MKLLKWFMFTSICANFACSSTTEPEKTNKAPTIAILPAPKAVPKGLNYTFSAVVNDDDNDTLYVQWSKSRGSLNPIDQGKVSMTWTAPTSVGTDTIVAEVTDGKTTRSDTLSIEVGSAWLGDINGSQTWTTANSPYLITPTSSDKFTITTTSMLTINAGVSVYIDAPATEILVNGELKIDGTADSPVIITPNVPSPPEGYWSGIRADANNQSGRLDLQYARIDYAKWNISANANSYVRLRNCYISHSLAEGVRFRSVNTLIIENCEISNNRADGIKIELFGTNNLPDSIYIIDSNIRYNRGSGVVISLRDSMGDVPFLVKGDSISYNAFHGIKLVSKTYPVINHNAIFFNDLDGTKGGYGIYLNPGFSGERLPPNDFIDARCNYWGGAFLPADSTIISDMIMDGRDRADISAWVRYAPWTDNFPAVCP